MSGIEASELLRTGLLEDVSILLAAPVRAGLAHDHEMREAAEVLEACTRLGARVTEHRWRADAIVHAEETPERDEALDRVLERAGAIDLLVVDAAGLFSAFMGTRDAKGASAMGAGAAALRACLEVSWTVTGAIANRVFLPAGGGRIVYLTPRPSAGEHAAAVRAGLENLARTLSVEWARHAVTAVAIAPGRDTPASEVGALTAYLASPAGAYFSGCLLELGGRRASPVSS